MTNWLLHCLSSLT